LDNEDNEDNWIMKISIIDKKRKNFSTFRRHTFNF